VSNPVGVALGQVVLFAKVVSQIVQFDFARVEELDEFPVAVADGPSAAHAGDGNLTLIQAGTRIGGRSNGT